MQTTQSAFADLLPRLFELKARVPEPTHPDAYFQDFETKLESTHVREQYQKLERTLAVLDADAWNDLRARATPYLMVRLSLGRGWQPLFDTFNEAKGYAYLQEARCTDIAFIPRANKKTPDIGARWGARRVLCEVKTINVSKDEAEKRTQIARGEMVGGSVPASVKAELLQKVSGTLAHGIEQLDGEDPQRNARRIVFTVLNFDDWVGDYQTQYIAQLDAHLMANPVSGAELVFCPASNLFPDRRFAMRSATIVEI